MLQEKGTAKKRYVDDTVIHFKTEAHAQLWLKSCLEREKVITEYTAKIWGRKVAFDVVFIDNHRTRNSILTVLELKRDIITLDMINQKIIRGYLPAIPLAFGIPDNYELIFVGSGIDAEAEYLLDDINNLSNLSFPTKSGVLKKVTVGYKSYEEILQEYFKRHNITNKQAKLMRNTYAQLSGHSDRLPWID